MDVLLTGRLAGITSEIGNAVSQRNKVVFASEDVNTKLIGKSVIPFKLSPYSKDFEKLFNSYNFEAALFFSQHPGEENTDYDEFQDLESCLRFCSDHDVNKVVYISSTAVYAGSTAVTEASASVPMDAQGVMFSACENLCEFYRVRKAMSVVILHIPFLFGESEKTSIIGNALDQAVNSASIRFKGTEDQVCDFLSQKDFGELLSRTLDDWPTEHNVINVPGGSALSFGQLGELFRLHFPTVRLSYSSTFLPVAQPVKSDIARREYDWIPILTLQDEFATLIEIFRREPEKEKTTFWVKMRNLFDEHRFIVRVVELLLGFALMEILNFLTGTTVQFQYIDFRLLYVVLFGTLYGIKIGFAASLLACLSLIIAYTGEKYGLQIIIFNIDNWLPFIAYIVMGTMTGYVKDRLLNDNKFLKSEHAVLEDKYILLNEFYVSALKNKGQYKNQIMSYRDSFGRMFDITRKLDSTVAESVFNEALQALEGVLENQSICIYTCDQNALFGRLVVCSNKISSITEKSLVLSNMTNMVNEFQDGEVWANKNRLLGYPEYAAPIFRDGVLVALIIIQKVKYEQMATYYENLIKVLCGLIKISLLRALEFTEKIEEDIYVPNTRIMVPEYFKRILSVKENMVEAGISEHSLIHFNTTPDTLIATSEIIAKKIRATDVMGIGSNGELYLCLAQTNSRNLDVVLERLQNSGIQFQQLSSSGE